MKNAMARWTPRACESISIPYCAHWERASIVFRDSVTGAGVVALLGPFPPLDPFALDAFSRDDDALDDDAALDDDPPLDDCPVVLEYAVAGSDTSLFFRFAGRPPASEPSGCGSLPLTTSIELDTSTGLRSDGSSSDHAQSDWRFLPYFVGTVVKE